MMRNPARGVHASDSPAQNPYSITGVLSASIDRDDKLSLGVKRMLKRNIIGSALTFVASAINLVVYFVDATSQIAYVCYTLCIIDVVLGVLVVQWLTFGSTETNDMSCEEAAANNFTNSAAALSSLTVPETINTQHKPSSM
ncbi:hypothetical protein E8E13_008096 [Curvularia kusanoi]|uniref:Uncharacterized protein n=1 Tax=Curvularia kusanoi TaxID=90978 RepID=A0A9P4W9I6_CURKU|nr:hypothetical protein E8E13_008096 [Curvularia kusanoi]